MILWMASDGLFIGNVTPEMIDKADIIIEDNIITQNRYGGKNIGITQETIAELGSLTLEEQRAFFQYL